MTPTDLDIVITGRAAISAAGVGLPPLEEVVRNGRSCLQPLPDDLSGETAARWGRTEGFRVNDFMPPLKARKFDRCSQFAVAATGMALKDAGVDTAGIDPVRIGIVLGCGFGGIANSSEFLSGYFTAGVDGLSPMLFPNTVANAPASNASIEHGIKGPNVTIVQRFCSAETALMIACRYLEEGRADLVVTGGVDEVTPLMIKGFGSMGQLMRYAGGFGEGCGLLVLERRESASRRGATVKGMLDAVRTVGLILPESEQEGVDRLIPPARSWSRISLSGTADLTHSLTSRLHVAPRLELARLTGRSLAMGGLSLIALLLSLKEGEKGLHLAASPEGPYVSLDVTGGPPV